MLLKSLKLKDFRQFNGEQRIDFSPDKQKNVTIIMGKNGAGKTTFAQAFSWCFYGKSILNGVLLSQELQDKMFPGDQEYVEVAVELVHHDREYTVKRRMKYKKDTNGQVVPAAQSADFTITCKDASGNTTSEQLPDLKMKEILPEELSSYFFFDGEHIEAMSKEINDHNRSRDIAEAVKRLLGLKAYDEALEHLGKGRSSVIGSYIESYNGNADSEMTALSQQIGELSDRIEEINGLLANIDASYETANDKIQDLDMRIAKNASSKELSSRREELEKKLKALEIDRKDKIGRFVKSFNSFGPKYFSTQLMYDSLMALKQVDKLDTGIPDVTASTINFLFNRKKCICGEHLEAGEEHYDALYKLLDSIPPKSLGSLIREFATACEEKTRSVEIFKDEFDDKYKFLRDYENTRSDYEEELKDISEKLDGIEDVSSLETERARYKRNLSSLSEDRDKLNQEKGEKISLKNNNEQRLHELSAGNVKNAEIDKYKSSAEYVYEILKQEYDEKETQTREKLAVSIDKIFQEIYNGGFSLALDEKYNIKVTPELQTSTGQSVAIILAFIAGVIKMARENSQAEGGTSTSEPYPLVMDAPLSAFDMERIQTVCEVLPQIAEQVIIFIKDTDGNYARQYLGPKIGARYKLDMVSKTRTDLLQGE